MKLLPTSSQRAGCTDLTRMHLIMGELDYEQHRNCFNILFRNFVGDATRF